MIRLIPIFLEIITLNKSKKHLLNLRRSFSNITQKIPFKGFSLANLTKQCFVLTVLTHADDVPHATAAILPSPHGYKSASLKDHCVLVITARYASPHHD